MFTANFEQSNKAGWTVQISATDAETGDDIDFTDAVVSVVVRDENRCQKLTATTANGKVTIPSATVVQFAFLASDMKCLCPASYEVGAVYQINGSEPVQLLTGSVSIYDGIASL